MQNILLIGSGRLARHLEFWNSINSTPLNIYSWNRKYNSIAELKTLLLKTDLVWLAISDSSLLTFFEQNLADQNKKCVHFSGVFHHEKLISAHPLMSFPYELMRIEVYPKIHFSLTGAENLTEALPGFQNNYSILNAEDKALYHALCVVAGNFPQFLWLETIQEFEKLKIPAKAFEIYIQQVTQNFIDLKSKALTGPLVRKDFLTVEKNLLSLNHSKLKTIYQKFIEVFAK